MTGPDPRHIACEILDALDAGKSNLDYLIADTFDPDFRQMAPRDRNFTFALVYGVLRTRGRLDWIIERFSRTGIDKMDRKVLNILRAALYQVFFMSRVPASAAVNTAVGLARKKKAPPWVIRFVNGLLRNAVKNGINVDWPDKASDPLGWLVARQSFPRWMITRWTNRFGIAEAERLCRFFNTIPPLTVRVNTLKTTREKLAASLDSVSEKTAFTAYSPEGIRVSGMKPPVSELDACKKGLFQVQDEAAQLVSHVLSPVSGEAVMDACAGVGGKTGHIGQLMNNTGTITAMDSHEGRLKKLEAQMKRLGIKIVTVLRRDLEEAPAPAKRLFYDRVLLDAPCSGTGVIRRNPDTRWRLEPEDPERFQGRQLRLLDKVADALKPGGTLVYAVCSIEPEETDAVVSGFLKARPGYAPKPLSGIAAQFPGADRENGVLRTIPHIHQMDGFFMAAFIKNG